MFKENLFEKIRSESVVIWAGAGLSISSGFPSGNELKKIIYENLSTAEQHEIDLNNSLEDIAQAVTTFRGRIYLISLLNKIFNKKIENHSTVHETISLIPHIKSIITTNYDRLIEQALDNSIPIYNESQIPYIEHNKKTKVFKVHGDLIDPDSIIITKDDYAKLLDQKLNNALWSTIKTLLTTNSILFIGYGLEDYNVLTILNKIRTSVGENMNEIYFVAPNISSLKQLTLTKKNIKYIDSTAEDFVNELYLNIKENIQSDLRKKIVSANTVKDFMAGLKLKPTLSIIDDNFDIQSIHSDYPIEIEGKFSVNDKDIGESLIRHFNNPSSKNFILEGDIINDFRLSFEGVNWTFPSPLAKIELLPIPIQKGVVDIFFEDGYHLNIFASVYRNNTGLDIKIKLTAGEIILNLIIQDDIANISFSIKQNDTCIDINTEIEFYELLCHLKEGGLITVITADNTKYTQQLSSFNGNEDFIFLLDYFKKLKDIESFFKVKFRNFPFSQINNKSNKDLLKIIQAIKGDEFEVIATGDLKIQIKSAQTEEGLFKSKQENVLKLIKRDDEFIELHKHNFDLGLKECYIFNPSFTCYLDESNVKIAHLKLTKYPIKVKYLFNEDY